MFNQFLQSIPLGLAQALLIAPLILVVALLGDSIPSTNLRFLNANCRSVCCFFRGLEGRTDEVRLILVELDRLAKQPLSRLLSEHALDYLVLVGFIVFVK